MNINDIKLFPHNQDTYEKIQESWKTSNRVASVQATGTGKSYLILKCLYNIPNENKIVLAPSNYILEQLEREAGEQLPNTTLMTYSDLEINTEDKINNLENIDLIVLDEFHRCGAESWETGVQKLLETYPNAKILGTSATHIRFLDNNRNMANELFNGNVANNLSLAEAIVKKILPMPKYVNAIYSLDSEILTLKNKVNNSKNTDEEKEDLLKEIDKMKNKLDKSKGIPQILKKHLNKDDDYKFMVFCKNVEHLNEMKKVVVDWFKKAKITKNIKTYTAYTGYNNIDKEVENFRNSNEKDTIKLLFSINIFNEGIHIKDVSGVILLRPTISPIIYYQQIGRGIQVGKRNNPVIFDFVNNFDNIGAKNFISDLKEYSRKQKENGNNSPEEFNQDDIEFMIFDEIQEAKILFEELEDRLIDNWDVMYNELIQYKNEFDNCNVSRDYKKNKSLSNWVCYQRISYKKGYLSNDKIGKLESIGFVWNAKDNWDILYENLKEYKEKNGNCDVSMLDKNNKVLGTWVNKQRQDYKKGELLEYRIKKLEEIDFKWKIREIWEDMYHNLILYKGISGNCNVPQNYNKVLATWVATQRKFYKLNKLSQIRFEKLKEIGFEWERETDIWEVMYKSLKKYKEEKKNFNISIQDKENKTLKNWIVTQRYNYKNGNLEKNKIKKLEQIGFIWNPFDDIWEIRYKELRRYRNIFNNCNIGKKENKILYTWIITQRQKYKNKTLSEEKIIKLNQIDFKWELRKTQEV